MFSKYNQLLQIKLMDGGYKTFEQGHKIDTTLEFIGRLAIRMYD
jgi:hypothetical protein